MIFFLLFWVFLVAQRLLELHIAKQNESWMKARGGVEVANSHYKWFMLLHTVFFLAVFFEVYGLSLRQDITPNWFFLGLFIFAQIGRIWCILSLGRFWNTKIIVLPKVVLMKKGPYRWVRHPNYLIVLVELFIIPIMFHAYLSAVLFPIIHVLLLTIRIPAEEEALER